MIPRKYFDPYSRSLVKEYSTIHHCGRILPFGLKKCLCLVEWLSPKFFSYWSQKAFQKKNKRLEKKRGKTQSECIL